METSNKNNALSKIASVVFPVKMEEMKKFIPMSIMLMLIIFIYSVLRGAKDTLLIPGEGGAEIISAVKLWGVLPSAVIFMIIYTKLVNIFTREKLFYLLTTFFIGFFAIYTIVLNPNLDFLRIDLSIAKQKFPFFRYVFLMVEDWAPSLFYIFSELWGSVMLSLMFWQFANQITPVYEAKRFYSLFGLIGQGGLIASGVITANFSSDKLIGSVADQVAAWQHTLIWLTFSIVVAGVILMYVYWWMNRYVLTDKRYYNPEEIEAGKSQKKKKVKLGLKESFKYIFSSKYLGLIALLVICYGVSINLVEGVWKSRMRDMYPIRNDYSEFMGYVQIATGFGTVIGMVIGVNVLKFFSWLTGALVTPLMIAITGILFFAFIIFNQLFESLLLNIGFTALSMAVIMGATQNVLSKSIKYSLFDSTKEMAYIPLDEELKVKGKAAVDVVGARFGKSGGAIIQFLLIGITGQNISSLTEVLFVLFMIIVGLWVYSVTSLSKQFENLTKK